MTMFNVFYSIFVFLFNFVVQEIIIMLTSGIVWRIFGESNTVCIQSY